jgi:hypothetical protein
LVTPAHAACAVWSNFEIGALDLWRGPAYSKLFAHLDQQGGFYYERWGDAPVHSIGAALFARKDQIHFFKDIGYRHDPFQVRARSRSVTSWLTAVCDSTARHSRTTRRASVGATSRTTLVRAAVVPFRLCTGCSLGPLRRLHTLLMPPAVREDVRVIGADR